MILYNTDDIELFAEEDNVFLIVKTSGIDMMEFSKICDSIPRVRLTKFGAAKSALDEMKSTKVLIGKLKEEVEIQISSDEMRAYVILNLSYSDYEKDKKNIANEIVYTLKENEIVEGIKKELFQGGIPLRDKILVAEGVEAIHGEDAIIEYYDFCVKKPIIKSDGKVNHYELNLIDNVTKNTWLGRKIPSTLGREGCTVRNNTVSAKSGRDYKLKFDDATVRCEISENGEENLYAKVDGAVKLSNGKVCVDNHLIINGDVEYSTGNIDFDGYVTVTGTVKDKFSITATYDISINGPMGIGAVDFIESKKGSVLLKGGVNGKGVARIKAYRDVYTKYANEALIDAGNVINIGFYAMDTIMNAKKILLPPTVGRIIGGQANAEHRIETGSIGNKFEKKTIINIEGFERIDVLETLELMKKKNMELIKKINKLKRELEIFEKNVSKLDVRAMSTYDYMISKFDVLTYELSEVALDTQKLEDILRTRGEGEVAISKNVYPKTLMEIKSLKKSFRDTSTGSFYVKDKIIHHNIN